MVRRLTRVLVLTALIFPYGVFALGLGELHLRSALNQDFDAEIDLLSVKPDELDGVKVTLASPEAFQQAGVDRPFILTRLRFKPDLNAKGKPVIHVTSREAIREPFLNFLLEVNWAKGRLVREYTVLLDPPVTLDRRPPPVVPPAAARPAAQPAQERVAAAPGPAPAQATFTPSEPAGLAGPSEYGPVQAHETLWRIAMATKPQGVSAQQMAVALQRKNPHAFFEGNLNNLKRGSILRIPTQEEIDLLSEQEARVEFSSQLARWKEPGPAAGPEAAPRTAGAEPMAPEEKGDTLKLASARPETEGEAGPSEGEDTEAVVARLENELMLAREQNESARQERDELSSQVKELESQLSDLKEMLTIRNEQLARLEAAFDKKAAEEEVAGLLGADEPPQEMDEVTDEPAAGEAEEEPELEIAGSAEDESLEEITPAGEPAVEEEIDLEIADAQDEGPAGPAAGDDIVPVAAQENAAPGPKPAESWTGSIQSIADKLLAFLKNQLEHNPIAVAGAGGGVLLLLILLLILNRRRASSDEFQESILVSADEMEDEEPPASDLAGDTEGPLSETVETSFLSEFSHSDLDVAQDDTGEVDPLAEADVYIAYGRYQQAEELVRQAIEREPDRLDFQYKLLEILSASGNATEFTKLAEKLAQNENARADSGAWEKIVSMGRQLNPGHALFAAAVAGGSVGAAGEALSAQAEDQASLAGAGESADDLDMLDLSDLAADFDLGEEPAAEDEGPEASEEGGDELTFDLDLETTGGEEPAADESVLSLDLEDEGLAEAVPGTEGLEEPEAPAVEESDLLDLEGLDLGDLEAELDVSVPPEADETAAPESPGLEAALDMTAAETGEAATEGLGNSDELADALSSLSDELPSSEELDDALSDISLDDLELGDLGEVEDIAPPEPEDVLPELPEGEDLLSGELEIEESGGDLLSELAEDEEDIDEVNTKLDLARAYVEMGDEEGARNILDEVMAEGDEAQKKEAQDLIDRFS